MTLVLYLAGGGSKRVTKYVEDLGCDRLFSQLNDRRSIAVHVEGIKNGNSGKLFIDSGAYSAWTKGVPVNVDEYINYLNELEPYCEAYAQVDCLPGRFGVSKTEQDIKEAPEKTWENYLYMRPKIKNPDKLLAVFHQREDFKWLHNMLETTFNGDHIKYIGISSGKDMPYTEWKDWFNEVFRVIRRSSNPNVKTHAFGMTSLNYLQMFPFTSCDSTTWIRSAGFGEILTHKYGALDISFRRRKNVNHMTNLSKDRKREVIKFFNDEGFTYRQMLGSSDHRAMMNAKYFKNWADDYSYKGNLDLHLGGFEF